MMKNDMKIAVLIDADNVSEKYIKFILDELSNHGMPTVKRIYGDWTKPNLGSWKNVLLEYSITPIQQYGYTTGKNATDSALIIDAMDILYSGTVDGFCIVSSDSDFTRLAARLRESAMYVVGMGERKTPKPFISACETFKYLEVLAQLPEPAAAIVKKASSNKEKEEEKEKKEIIKAIRQIVEDASDEEGWAHLGEVGTRLNKRYPDFDVRNFGVSKLTQLVRLLKVFDVQSQKTNNPRITHYYIRNK